MRGARAGRNHNALRFSADDFFDGNLVVAMHLDVATKLAEILREVIGEGVVVVEQQNHGRWPELLRLCAASRAVSNARDLFTDSWYSLAASESATMPPPACTCATPFLMTIVRRAIQESRLPAKSK